MRAAAPTSRSPRTRRILHVDVDAMFVQCAVMADPARLEGQPLILVGGSSERRGVVTSASYGCRALGVRSAMPMATALRLCPDAVVVPVPRETVRQASRTLAEALDLWSPVVNLASVDEAYLDLTGTEALHLDEPLEATAWRIREDVRERTRLEVSIGGGTNRLVAKLATSRAKPAGVHVVPPGREEAFVASLEISDLPGVGPVLLDALRRRGIGTMAALRALPAETLAVWLGEDRAQWLWRRCRGMDSSPSGDDRGARSISSETTFSRDTADPELLESALLEQVVTVAASLRRQGLFARTLTVRLRDADFRDRSRSRTLPEPIRTDRAIYAAARALLDDLRRQRSVPARLVGVGLTNLVSSADNAQGVLFGVAPPLEDERDRRLSGAVDEIRRRHGEVIHPGSVLRGKGRQGPGATG